MAYFKVGNADNIMRGCMEILTVLCSIPVSTWDWYKRLTALIYLAEYIVVSHKSVGVIKDGYYYVEHKKVISDYPNDMRRAISVVLNARDYAIHLPKTDDQIRLWNKAWDDGCVVEVLKHEGFI